MGVFGAKVVLVLAHILCTRASANNDDDIYTVTIRMPNAVSRKVSFFFLSFCLFVSLSFRISVPQSGSLSVLNGVLSIISVTSRRPVRGEYMYILLHWHLSVLGGKWPRRLF